MIVNNTGGSFYRRGGCRYVWRREWRGWASGQSATELALMAPVLIILLLVAADFGRLFYLSVAVNNAARTGVQYGAQNVGTASQTASCTCASANTTTCTSSNNCICAAAYADASNINGFTATPSEFCQCDPADGGAVVTCPGASGATPCPTMSDMRIYVQVNTAATFKTVVSWPGIPSSVQVNGSAVMREQ